MATRKNDVSLDALNPFDLEGTAEDIALVERGLAIMARKQVVWTAVVDTWKRKAGVTSSPPGASMPEPPKEREAGVANMATLIELYRVDQRSPFKSVHFSTRENYSSLLRRLDRELGGIVLVRCKAEDIQSAYEGWVKTGATAMAHSLVTMLRGLFGFGATILGDSECERLSVIMHKMRFPVMRTRSVRMTPDQAMAIIRKAHEKGLNSVALAQAIQFELGLRQKVVIGDWVPIDEPGESDIKSGSMKWLRGLRWGELDPSKLVDCPTVKAAMDRVTTPKIGPMIVYEKTQLPYLAHQWRREWREIATEAGVPTAVYNMDSSRRRSSAKTGNGHADDFSDDDLSQEARH